MLHFIRMGVRQLEQNQQQNQQKQAGNDYKRRCLSKPQQADAKRPEAEAQAIGHPVKREITPPVLRGCHKQYPELSGIIDG
ncbi:hypothetical protein D3C81_1682310 [compost metagenome]